MPGVFQTIRFRLSFAVAVTVFSIGSLLVGGIYLYSVNQLDEPVVQARPINLVDTETGEITRLNAAAVFPQDLQQAAVEWVELEAYKQALNELRRASFGAMGLLFFFSFATGWVLAGWALSPLHRINGVAREITATDLSRRIAMRGPSDEMKNLADTFDAMLDRLQDSFEDQRRFVHEASHELRNPLAVARTNLELVLDSDDEEELKRAVAIAHTSTGRMSTLVEDLLEQARTGVPEVRRDRVDLSQIVADTAVGFRAAAGQRSITIAADMGGGEVVVHGDEAALRRAVSNLVANAVRLAPTGSTVTLATTCPAADFVTITVADEGPGIAEADMAHVFERFWRGQNAGTGSGLGLSIVAQIAERHGGGVSVESQVGVGSTFTIKVPLGTDAHR